MTDTTRLRISYAFTLLAVVLIVIGFVGMQQTPRAPWSRYIAVPALLLVLAGRALRRRLKRER